MASGGWTMPSPRPRRVEPGIWNPAHVAWSQPVAFLQRRPVQQQGSSGDWLLDGVPERIIRAPRFCSCFACPHSSCVRHARFALLLSERRRRPAGDGCQRDTATTRTWVHASTATSIAVLVGCMRLTSEIQDKPVC